MIMTTETWVNILVDSWKSDLPSWRRNSIRNSMCINHVGTLTHLSITLELKPGCPRIHVPQFEDYNFQDYSLLKNLDIL